jgi:hypothetical protein
MNMANPSHAGESSQTLPTDPSDHTRWSTSENLSRTWDERAKMAAEWIPAKAAVADIGCGNMAVERFLTLCEYVPVDLYVRDARTTVVNLNTESIPDFVVSRVDHATLLGVLEYLTDPHKLLRQLSEAGITVVCTYQLANFTDHDERHRNGWFNHFRGSEMVSLFNECGFAVAKSRCVDTQGMYLLIPDRPKFKAQSPAAVQKTGKPKIVLSGFFGRGNAGDEAILQVQYEKLSPHFDIIISTDERGAYDGFWNWFPYNQCKLIHHADTSIFAQEDIVGLHVGGGDLPLGFNGAQVISALSHGKTVLATGVDGKWLTSKGGEPQSSLLPTLLELAPATFRSKSAFERAQTISDRANWGADWALELQTDCDPNAARDIVLLTFREFPVERINHETLQQTQQLVSAIEKRGWDVALFPFCPEDERFLNHLAPTFGLPREVHWWNPRRMKQLVKQARLVVSVGRFHPLVFAASVGTPCLFSDWGVQSSHAAIGSKTDKAAALCDEVGGTYFPKVNELTEFLERGEAFPSACHFSDSYHQRFQTMVSSVIDQFRRAAPQVASSKERKPFSLWNLGRRTA